MRAWLVAAILALAVTPAFAHRLDEYLQGTIISVGKTQLQAQMTLTPGVAVVERVMTDIDADGNGTVSDAEQTTYAERVLRDLSLTIDGHALVPRLVSIQFSPMDEMQGGRGKIQLDFSADLPPGGRNRKLTLENDHQHLISAYQVNCLRPRDPDIRIAAQNRDYSQSLYTLEYERTDVRAESSASALSGWPAWLSPIVIIATMRLTRWCRVHLRSEGTHRGEQEII